jgi:hypothetical protein
MMKKSNLPYRKLAADYFFCSQMRSRIAGRSDSKEDPDGKQKRKRTDAGNLHIRDGAEYRAA